MAKQKFGKSNKNLGAIMNIAISCLVIKLDSLGGLQYRLKNIIEGFCECGHNVKIVQTPFAYNGSKHFYQKLGEYKVEPILIPYHISDKVKLCDIVRLYNFEIFDVLNQYELDILDTYDPYTRISKKHIPMVYSTNYLFPYLVNQIIYGGFRQSAFHILKVLCEQFTIYKSDMIIVENSNQKRWLNKWIKTSNQKINVILPGYDENTLEEIDKNNHNDFNEDELVILFVGRITYLKGVFELLKAFSNIYVSNKNYRLIYIGDGPDKRKLELLTIKLGLPNVVKFRGELCQLKTLEIVKQSHVFVLPSYNEGVPLSIIEAMVLKKPIIASNVGGISIHLIENNVNGVLIKPKNIKELENALNLLCSNQDIRKKYGLNSWKKANFLTNMKMVNDTLQTYEKTINQHR